MEEIKLGKYRHYKGGEYNVMGVGEHTETGEKFVVYEQLYDSPEGGTKKGKKWIRPLKMFLSDKVLESGEKVRRFKFIGNQD